MPSDRDLPASVLSALGCVQLTIDLPARFTIEGNHAVSAWVAPPAAVVGRSPAADVEIDDPTCTVSRRHLLIERDGLGWVARDCGSTHGTRLRWLGAEHRLPPAWPEPLLDGMRLAVGDIWLRVGIVAAPEAPGAATVGRPGTAPPAPDPRVDLLMADRPGQVSRREVAIHLTAPYRRRPPQADHLPVPEIAALLHCSERTVHNAIDDWIATPLVRSQMAQTSGQGRTRELAAALVRVFPRLAHPMPG